MKITWAVKSFNFSIQNLKSFNFIFNFQILVGTTLDLVTSTVTAAWFSIASPAARSGVEVVAASPPSASWRDSVTSSCGPAGLPLVSWGCWSGAESVGTAGVHCAETSAVASGSWIGVTLDIAVHADGSSQSGAGENAA